MRTALLSSTLVVNYRAFILYKGYFVEAATLEYITGACMSTYRMAICITVNTEDMILISHFAY